jgi:hypothetical protein
MRCESGTVDHYKADHYKARKMPQAEFATGENNFFLAKAPEQKSDLCFSFRTARALGSEII